MQTILCEEVREREWDPSLNVAKSNETKENKFFVVHIYVIENEFLLKRTGERGENKTGINAPLMCVLPQNLLNSKLNGDGKKIWPKCSIFFLDFNYF